MSRAADGESAPKTLLRSLDSYWFGHGSPTTIGLLRIILGFLSLANCILLGMHWESWFSEKGYVPAWLGQLWLKPSVPVWNDGPNLYRIDLLNGITDPRITIPFFCLVAFFSFTTMLGLWTRFSTVALALGVLSLQNRNGEILHGGDSVLRLGVIYLAIAPSGLACSLDRMIGLWKGRIASGPVRVSLWSQRLVCYNVALVYFTTVWLKFDGELWRNGTASFYPARLAEFYRFPVPSFINNVPFIYVSSYGVLLTEFALGTLVFFRPLRKYVLTAGILMHGWIEYSMNIPLFSFLMIGSYICFYDGEEIAGWASRVGNRFRRWRVGVFFPAGMRLRTSAAAFLDSADPCKLVTYAPAAGPVWQAERADGSEISAPMASLSRSPGAWLYFLAPARWKRLLDRALEPAPNPAPEEAPAELIEAKPTAAIAQNMKKKVKR